MPVTSQSLCGLVWKVLWESEESYLYNQSEHLQSQRARIRFIPKTTVEAMTRGTCERLSAWSSSCLLVKVRVLWGGCVSISDLDSAIPWPGVLHSLSVSFSYSLSISYQFQTIRIHDFFHSSPPVFLPRLTSNFLQVSLSFPCKHTIFSLPPFQFYFSQ